MIILHMEDEGPLLEVFKTVLNMVEPKIEVVQFADSDSALEYIEANIDKIKVFVLDIRVPGKLDGMGIAQRIRELGSDRPLIITSAYRRPGQNEIRGLDIIWMPKPMHILNVAQRIVPWAQQ